MKTPPLFVALLAAVTLTAARGADSPVWFRASFDDAKAATLHGSPLPPSREVAPRFASDESAKWFAAGAGAALEYDLGPGFPSEAGAIEVRFKPGFPQTPAAAARVLFSLRAADETGVDFGFSPQGTRWEFQTIHPQWERRISAWYFDAKDEQRWNHLVLTWDTKSPTGPQVRLFRDGRWERPRTEAYRQPFRELRRLVIGGAADPATAVDEIMIYREALSETDVAALHGAFGSPDRLAVLSRARAELAAKTRAANAARKAQAAQLNGRIAYLINPRGGEQRDFRLPGGLTAIGLRVEDVGQVDLSRFAVIYGPPGGGYQLTTEQDAVIRRFVEDGGAYVGVCAGANYAAKCRLLNMSTHTRKNQGLVSVGMNSHPITDGYSGEVMIHHGNGPIMVPGEGCEVVGSFLIGQKFPVTTAAIVAGTLGKGRVVAFGPHPTGGGVQFESKGAHFSGSELGTEGLLVNALFWAGKVTGVSAP